MEQHIPFTKLPNEAQALALSLLDNIELIAFSLISQRAFASAKSLNRVRNDISLDIGSDVTLSFEVPSKNELIFYKDETPSPTKFHSPQTVTVRRYQVDPNSNRYSIIDRVWKNRTMVLKAWIQHIMALFHQSRLKLISIFSVHRFSVDDMHLLFAGSQVKELNFECNNMTTRIQAPLLLVPDQFMCFSGSNTFQPPFEMQLMLLQNVPTIKFINFQNLQLNDLLSCNSKEIWAAPLHISAKELRKWFKLWQNGANPRLETMHILFHANGPEIDWFLKSFSQYTDLPREATDGYARGGAVIKKGFEIWRKNRRGSARVALGTHGTFACDITMKVFN